MFVGRVIAYSLEQIRSWDALWGWRLAMINQAVQMLSTLGSNATVLTGFTPPTQTSPSSSLVINVPSGEIYAYEPVDATVYGALAGDADLIMQLGYTDAQQLTFNTSGLTTGQGKWALVQCAFSQVNEVMPGDPDGGVLPYVNVQSPPNPLSGPGGSGAVQNTLCMGTASLSVKYGSAAASADAVPPTADANNVPLFLILLTYGQTAITTGDIQIAGPVAYSDYPYAPIFPGVTGSLPGSSGSHHGGIAGQANQILLTNGAEVQGILPLPYLPVSNPAPSVTGGDVVEGGTIPILTILNVNPGGNLAGLVQDLAFNEALGTLYVCKTTGSASTAVWIQVGNSIFTSLKSSFPFTPAAGGIYLCDTTSGAGSSTFADSSTYGGIPVEFICLNNGSTNQMLVYPASGEQINYGGAGNPVYLNPGDHYKFIPLPSGGWVQ